MVYWITGKAHSGKTTFAYSLRDQLRTKGLSTVILDGDEIREAIGNQDYSNRGRWLHIERIAKLAQVFERQGVTPIIALVSPYKRWRQKARELFESSKLIYLPGGTLWEGTEYEEPDKEELYDYSFSTVTNRSNGLISKAA